MDEYSVQLYKRGKLSQVLETLDKGLDHSGAGSDSYGAFLGSQGVPELSEPAPL